MLVSPTPTPSTAPPASSPVAQFTNTYLGEVTYSLPSRMIDPPVEHVPLVASGHPVGSPTGYSDAAAATAALTEITTGDDVPAAAVVQVGSKYYGVDLHTFTIVPDPDADWHAPTRAPVPTKTVFAPVALESMFWSGASLSDTTPTLAAVIDGSTHLVPMPDSASGGGVLAHDGSFVPFGPGGGPHR